MLLTITKHLKSILKSIIFRFSLIEKIIIKPLPYKRGYFQAGINVIGFFTGNLGLGQGVRVLSMALDRGNVTHANIDAAILPPEVQVDTSFTEKLQTKAQYAVNLIHVNPPEFFRLERVLGKENFDRHYNIGYWLWELDTLPREWTRIIPYFDEFWAPSEFICSALKKETDKPVRLIPYGIELDTNALYDRQYFGLSDDDFICLCMYDSNSYSSRKNPIAAIEAFRKAFGDSNVPVKMLLKVNNAKKSDLLELRKNIGDSKQFILVDRVLSRKEMTSLLKCMDVFISLHRSEGFGFVIAEAMYLGVPTIVTDWSANVDFTNRENSCSVDYKLIPVGNAYSYYIASAMWADANIDQAAEYLKRLYTQPQYREEVAKNGQSFIRQNYSIRDCGQKMGNRLKEILDG